MKFIAIFILIWMMDEIELFFLSLVCYSFLPPPPPPPAAASLSAPAICWLHELHVRILRTQKKKKRWRSWDVQQMRLVDPLKHPPAQP